jgi:hypothetical protein
MIFSKDVPLSHRATLVLAGTLTVRALRPSMAEAGFAGPEILAAGFFWFLVWNQWRTRARNAQLMQPAAPAADSTIAPVQHRPVEMLYWVLVLLGAFALYYTYR